ncbi:BTB/POZ domain-containing protein 6-like [Mytilus edulis]|uniref:BTB/POZ domain-containing protein 6-like n=1 Tax=Mytilus edulis TaxID=6550 RepID=UPI0039F127E8
MGILCLKSVSCKYRNRLARQVTVGSNKEDDWLLNKHILQMSEEVIDWRHDKSPQDCLKYLLFKETLSDVHFIFNNDYSSGRVPAHTFVLAMRSAVFEDELFTERAEHEDILVEDISKDIFEMMLKYIYTNMTKITNANSVGLLQAAMKYQIQGLADLCVAHMERSLNRNNVCKILDEAVNFEIPSLKTSALYFLSNFTREVFKTEGFLSLSYTSLDLILDLDKLSTSEIEVFKAVVLWADEQCKKNNIPDEGENKRNILGDMFYKLRIPAMTLRQYSNIVVTSELLTEQEQLQLFKYFTLQPSSKSKVSVTIANFPLKPRLRTKALDDWQPKKSTPTKKKQVRFASSNQVNVTQLPAEPVYGDDNLDAREVEAQEVFG